MPGFGHEQVENVGATTPAAWIGFTCGHCGHKVSGAIVAGVMTGDPVGPAGRYLPAWFRCSNCGEPSCLDTKKEIHPGPPAGVLVGGLPSDVEAAYDEARRCLTVNAYTACELLCRKLLMHVAADKAGAGAGKKFAAYVTDLEEAGYITPPMKAWVDLIRKHANEATHELPAASRERAEGTLMFTAELLRIVSRWSTSPGSTRRRPPLMQTLPLPRVTAVGGSL